MKRILRYHKNRKGITIVLVALMLVVLLMFLGMAVDIAYMYFVKNQLQVAADSAALAGTDKIDCDDLNSSTCQLIFNDTNASNYRRIAARREAWKFACKNRAASAPVFLVTNNPQNCDTPPASGLNESANAPDGDIVVGNWNLSTKVFTPATGSTGLIINALQARPRRTGETPGMPQATVFVGQIFRMIGTNWSLMSASASAVAMKVPRASEFVAVGMDFCPKVGTPACQGGTGSTYPIKCILTPPREVVASPSSAPFPLKFGWTSLLLRPGNSNDFEDLMCATSPYQDICSGPGIWGISGTSDSTLRVYKSLMYDPMFDTENKSCATADLKCHTSSDTVIGWTVLIPVVNEQDPMFGPDPHPVWGYALVHMTAVCASGGSAGCSNRPNPPNNNSIPGCGPGDKKIVIDQMSCISCGTPATGLKVALVK